MQFADYLLAFGLGTGVVLGAAFPLLAAIVVACWPGDKPKSRWWFVAVCSVLAYGISGVLSVLSLPFELFDTHITPTLHEEGQRAVPTINTWLLKATEWLPIASLVVGSVAVPVLARRHFWALVHSALANKRLQPIGREDAPSG
jgi:MFS family permease